MKRFLIPIAIIIHLFFYVSAVKTHTLDYFFSWGNVHEWQGIDFYQVPNGAYYFNNIRERIGNPIGGPPGIFTLDAILRFWRISFYDPIKTKVLLAFLFLFLQFKLRLNLYKGLFLWVSYYLLFYDFVFEYHYTTLAVFLAIGILTQKELKSNFAKILALSFVLPSPFFLFHFFQIGAIGHNVTNLGWTILVLFRILPLILLNLLIIIKVFIAQKAKYPIFSPKQKTPRLLFQ